MAPMNIGLAMEPYGVAGCSRPCTLTLRTVFVLVVAWAALVLVVISPLWALGLMALGPVLLRSSAPPAERPFACQI